MFDKLERSGFDEFMQLPSRPIPAGRINACNRHGADAAVGDTL